MSKDIDWDDEIPTPAWIHAKPKRQPPAKPSVVQPSTLAPLGRAPVASRVPTTPGLGAVTPDPFPLEEAPTPTVPTEEQELAREAARLVRNWRACEPDRRKQLSRMALVYRKDAEGLGR